PVAFPDGEGALVLTIQEGAITAFTYPCRAYALTEQESTLLPPAMAIAIASLRPDTGLALSYVDNGAETLSARWPADCPAPLFPGTGKSGTRARDARRLDDSA